MIDDIARLRRRRDMFLRAISEMEAIEAEIRLELGDAYREPQALIWARQDLEATEALLRQLG